MPYPDWVEGKRQFTRVEYMMNALALGALGSNVIESFNGSGEILEGKILVEKAPDTFNGDDSLQLFIDGILLQKLKWYESCYLHTCSWTSPIRPGYYDDGVRGVMIISGSTSFFSSMEFKYNKSDAGTISVFSELTLGIY